MKILITGGFGYLGGRLAMQLAITNNEVSLASRSFATSPEWLPQAQAIRINWNSKSSVAAACAGVDAIVHAAGLNAQDCSANLVDALEVNGLFTARLLQEAIKQGIKRFIYISTAHVYGNDLFGIISEKTIPESIHPYATSHRAGEEVVLAAHNREEIEGIVVRLSNAFGMPAHKNVDCWMLLVNDLCRQAITSKNLVLKTAGKQQRNFITLTDACNAIEYLLGIPNDKLDGGLFNVGGMNSATVLDMANKISNRVYNMTGDRPEITCRSIEKNINKPRLDYKIDKLIATGFSLQGDINSEIDKLLQFLTNQIRICL
jgi:UDP-glucose 4-epimerase